MGKTVLTIGHSTHTADYFLSLLQKHDVQTVCDVRSVPYSQHTPQFNREPLKERLHEVGISYVFLGKELGARSDNPACYIDGKVQYNYLVDEPGFKYGLRRLCKGIETFRIALMCAERDPLTCHRSILVCRELRDPSLAIKHILADGSIENHASAERRLMSMLNVRPDLLNNEQECIEQAYNTQGRKIAYVRSSKQLDKYFGATSNEGVHDRIYE